MHARHIVAASGALLALLGLTFEIIAVSWFATAILLAGVGLICGGLWPELSPIVSDLGKKLSIGGEALIASLVAWKAARARAKAEAVWPRLDTYRVEVVGESHYQDALAAAARRQSGGPLGILCTAQLVPERNNRADANAVAVHVNRKTVGYLSREDARAFRRRLAETGKAGRVTTCGALIKGGGERANGEPIFYGIWLDLERL